MRMRLNRELEGLKSDLLKLCAQVENHAQTAAVALRDRDIEQAEKIIRADYLIDSAEVEIEEECLKILALHQPVAMDLRFVITVIKINGCLERIGDLTENLARKARSLARKEAIAIPAEFFEMSTQAVAMLHKSIDAFVAMDSALAAQVVAADREVDMRKRSVRKYSEQAMTDNPNLISSLVTLIAASRNIERIADLAADIAEEVIYLVEGRIVRHRGDAE